MIICKSPKVWQLLFSLRGSVLLKILQNRHSVNFYTYLTSGGAYLADRLKDGRIISTFAKQ